MVKTRRPKAPPTAHERIQSAIQRAQQSPEEYAVTPLGPGWVVNRDGAVVAVLVHGYSAPHDFPVGEVRPISATEYTRLVPTVQTAVKSSYRKTGPMPVRGQHKQILVQLAETFSRDDVRHALLHAVGERKVKPMRFPERRVGALIRQMLKKGYIA